MGVMQSLFPERELARVEPEVREKIERGLRAGIELSRAIEAQENRIRAEAIAGLPPQPGFPGPLVPRTHFSAGTLGAQILAARQEIEELLEE